MDTNPEQEGGLTVRFAGSLSVIGCLLGHPSDGAAVECFMEIG